MSRNVGILSALLAVMVVTLGYLASGPSRMHAERSLAAQARQYAQAYVKNDYARLIDMTDPRVVKAMGGAEAVQQQREENARKADALWPERSITVGAVTSLADGAGQKFGVVPFVLELASAEKKGRVLSYLVGISHDHGATWKFVDGGRMPRAMLTKLLPDLPADLQLPEAEPRP